MATVSSIWWSDVWAVCQKEIRSELRTRYALNAIVMFAVTTVTVKGEGGPRNAFIQKGTGLRWYTWQGRTLPSVTSKCTG